MSSNNLLVNGNAEVGGNASIGYNTVIAGNALVAGKTTMAGSLAIAGATTLGGSVVAAGTLNVYGKVAMFDAAAIQGIVSMYNAVNVYSNLHVTGDISGECNLFIDNAAIVGSNLEVGGSLIVTSNVTIFGTYDVFGISSTSNAAYFSSNVTAVGEAFVVGATTLSNSLTVVGPSTLSNALTVYGASVLSNTSVTFGIASTSNAAYFSSNVTVVGKEYVIGTTTLSNSLTVVGPSVLSNALTVYGATVLSNTAVTYGVSSTSNAAYFSSNVTAVGQAYVVGTTTLSNSLTVVGPSALSNALTVYGASILSNTLVTFGIASTSNAAYFSSNVTAVGQAYVVGTTTLSNSLTVVGPSVLSNALTVYGATVLSNTSVTYGVSSTSNAAYFSSNVTAVGQAFVVGTTTLSNSLTVVGVSTLSNNLSVYGASVLSNTAVTYGVSSTSNAAFFSSNVTVQGGVQVYGAITASNNVTVTSNLTVLGSLNVQKIDFQYSNVTVFTSETINSNLTVTGMVTVGSTDLTSFSSSYGAAGNVMTYLGGTGQNLMYAGDILGISGFSLGLDSTDSGKFKISTGASRAGSFASPQVTITSTNFVGINNASPANALDVVGSAKISGSLSNSGNFANVGTMLCGQGNSTATSSLSQLALGYNAGGYLHTIKSRHNSLANTYDNAIDLYVWQTSDSASAVGTKQAMSVTSAGTGIFTTTPAYPLDVVGAARCSGSLYVGTGVGSGDLYLQDIATAAWHLGTSGFKLSFGSGTTGGTYTERMSLTNAGALSVSGSLTTNGNTLNAGATSLTSVTVSGGAGVFQGNAAIGGKANVIASFQAATTLNANDAGIVIGSTNGNTPYISDNSSTASGGFTIGSGSYSQIGLTKAGALNLGTSSGTLMSMLNTNVGILQTNPQYPLDVTGSARVTGTLTAGSISCTTINASGAISTTGTLTVGTSGANESAIFFAGQAGDNGVAYSAIISRNFDPAGGTAIASDYSEILITQGNDAGTQFGPDRIRHLAPAHKFQVYNTSLNPADTNTFYADSNFTNAMYISPVGYVGINTTSPGEPLDVSGNARVSGEVISTSANNFRSIQGSYGSFWRNDGATLYLLLTNSGDQYGSWNSLRPFQVDLGSGSVSIAPNLTVSGTVTASTFSGSLSGTATGLAGTPSITVASISATQNNQNGLGGAFYASTNYVQNTSYPYNLNGLYQANGNGSYYNALSVLKNSTTQTATIDTNGAATFTSVYVNGSINCRDITTNNCNVNAGSGTMYATTFSGNLSGNCSGSSGSCTGNTATASKLLGGTSFQTNSWFNSDDGVHRLHFTSNGTSYYESPNNTHMFRGGGDGDYTGNIFCASITTNGNNIDCGGGTVTAATFAGNCTGNANYANSAGSANGLSGVTSLTLNNGYYIKDAHHGIAYCSSGTYGNGSFAGGYPLDGPAVFGWTDGALGTTSSSKVALRWDSSQNVTVNGNLTVSGSINVSGGISINRYAFCYSFTDTSLITNSIANPFTFQIDLVSGNTFTYSQFTIPQTGVWSFNVNMAFSKNQYSLSPMYLVLTPVSNPCTAVDNSQNCNTANSKVILANYAFVQTYNHLCTCSTVVNIPNSGYCVRLFHYSDTQSTFQTSATSSSFNAYGETYDVSVLQASQQFSGFLIQ